MIQFVFLAIVILVFICIYKNGPYGTNNKELNNQPLPEIQTPDEEMKSWEPKWGHLTVHEDIGLVNFTVSELKRLHNPEPFAVHEIVNGKTCIFKNKPNKKWVVTNIKSDGHAYSTEYFDNADAALTSLIRRVVPYPNNAVALQKELKDDFIRSSNAWSP